MTNFISILNAIFNDAAQLWLMADYNSAAQFLFQIYSFNVASLSVLPAYLSSDINGSKGNTLPIEPLPDDLVDAMNGELLGDGCLRFNKKGKDGKPKPNTNAQFAMTLKYKEHVDYLWSVIYKPICTNTPPFPWPNPKTGKPLLNIIFLLKH